MTVDRNISIKNKTYRNPLPVSLIFFILLPYLVCLWSINTISHFYTPIYNYSSQISTESPLMTLYMIGQMYDLSSHMARKVDILTAEMILLFAVYNLIYIIRQHFSIALIRLYLEYFGYYLSAGFVPTQDRCRYLFLKQQCTTFPLC